jgi:Protein of unknown function (DUF3592)
MLIAQFFLALTFLAGAVALGAGTYLLRAAAQAPRWPRAPGTILHCSVRKIDVPEGVVDELAVGYVYEVGGRRYQGSRLTLTGNRVDAGGTGELREFPAGATVMVAYDPALPRRGVLRTTVDRKLAVAWTLVGAVTAGASLLALLGLG